MYLLNKWTILKLGKLQHSKGLSPKVVLLKKKKVLIDLNILFQTFLYAESALHTHGYRTCWYKGQLYYAILYKGIEHLWILVSVGVLEPIPLGYRGATI